VLFFVYEAWRKRMGHIYDWSGAAIVAIVAILTYRLFIFPTFFSPLSRIPNAHWSAPFSRTWILWVRFVQRENRTLHDAHRRLGPVIRVGPNELSIDGLENVRVVYQGGFEKPGWYSVFDNYGYGNRFEDAWKGLRLHNMVEVCLACSQPEPVQSTRRASG
jgi:hypothetical protein